MNEHDEQSTGEDPFLKFEHPSWKEKLQLYFEYSIWPFKYLFRISNCALDFHDDAKSREDLEARSDDNYKKKHDSKREESISNAVTDIPVGEAAARAGARDHEASEDILYSNLDSITSVGGNGIRDINGSNHPLELE